LESFIKYTLKSIFEKQCKIKCAIDFAGPVFEHRKAKITNWCGSPTITLRDLINWGFPDDRTLMLNDQEAAAYGLLNLLEEDPTLSKSCKNIYRQENEVLHVSPFSSMILLSPGTGLGTVGIIYGKAKNGNTLRIILPSEIQHSPIYPLDYRHERLIKWFRKNINAGIWPSWEDFASGDGLVNIYKGMQNINNISHLSGTYMSRELSAEKIADNAIKRNDLLSEQALDLYYRCVGRMAQTMALLLQPYGGIFLCGHSINKNEIFIDHSGMIREIHSNKNQRDLLMQFPISIIKDEDINIKGGLWICKEMIPSI
jgi:glucokinase